MRLAPELRRVPGFSASDIPSLGVSGESVMIYEPAAGALTRVDSRAHAEVAPVFKDGTLFYDDLAAIRAFDVASANVRTVLPPQWIQGVVPDPAWIAASAPMAREQLLGLAVCSALAIRGDGRALAAIFALGRAPPRLVRLDLDAPDSSPQLIPLPHGLGPSVRFDPDLVCVPVASGAHAEILDHAGASVGSVFLPVGTDVPLRTGSAISRRGAVAIAQRETGLIVVEAGEAPRLIDEAGHSPIWTPAGDRLWFMRRGRELWSWLVGDAAAHFVLGTTGADGRWESNSPAVSETGRLVAAELRSGNAAGDMLVVLDSATGEVLVSPALEGAHFTWMG